MNGYSTPSCSLGSEGEMAGYIILYTDSGLWPLVWLDCQWLWMKMIGNDMMKEFGEETHGWTSLNRHKTQRYFCSMWRLTKGSVLIIRMPYSVDTCQPLPQSTLSSPRMLMSKVAMVAGVGVMHRLNNMDFHSPSLTRLWLLLRAQFTSRR